MSGQRKQRPPKDPDATFGAAPAPVMTAPEETRPPTPARAIVRCADCMWGQDVSIGQRRCRGSTPHAYYRMIHGHQGDVMAVPMWPVVRDDDYCARGEPK